jgi:hypothetical protein
MVGINIAAGQEATSPGDSRVGKVTLKVHGRDESCKAAKTEANAASWLSRTTTGTSLLVIAL